MNGFRKSGYAGPENRVSLPFHTKCQRLRGAKRRCWPMLLLALGLLTSCNHTPMYQGPPNLILHVLMKKWAIVPSRIVVPQGAHVELIITTEDVEHGIGVPALDIDQPVQPGRTTVVKFLALKPGSYPMHCSVLCGRGHDLMKGEIVITPSPAAAAARKSSSGPPVHK